MGKTYQPQVIVMAQKMIDSLIEGDFFKECEIKDTEPGRIVICDYLTKKFIEGKMSSDGSIEISNDEEFSALLSRIISTSTLDSLKEKGLLDSIDDENGEEVFFLTDKGKETSKKL